MEDKLDKMYDLIEKMYSDLTQQIKGVSKEQQRQGAILENDIKGDIKALYDGYKQTYEKLATVENKIDNLSSKVDKQEVEFRVLKGGK